MAGYIGTKAVNLSTTAANVGGDADIGGDLTVDTSTLHVDSANNRVGVGTILPSDVLHVVTPTFGGMTLECTGATADPTFKFLGDSGNYWSLQQDASQGDSFQFRYNNSEKVRIDSAGRVTMPYQPAAFVAKDNGGGWTTFSGTMVFNDVKLNRGNCYNSSTGIFTCPAAGVYRVHAEALTGNVTTSCHVKVYKNGSSVVASGAHSNYQGSTYYTIGTEALVQCAVNDQLSVFMSSSNNALYQNTDYAKATFMMVG
jgi:hypothetical protein